MSEPQPAALPINEQKPNHFFFQSPFRSWQFLINTGLVVVICLAVIAIFWGYWDKLNRHSSVGWLSLLLILLQTVVYPYWWALHRHRKINKLYLSGAISGQPAGSPVDDLLSVADDSINEGLRNTMCCFGLFLVGFVWWRIS